LPNRGFAKRLFANWPAKILSLAAALLLFSFYRLNRLEDRYISVPLSVSMNDEYVPSSQYPRTVRATLRGESNALFAIQDEDVRASLDLSGYHAEGQYRVPIQIERKGSALGVDPLEIRTDPSDVAVTMERRITRVVPVTPSFKGFLEPGYELVSFEMSPSEVEVSGPASAIARVADVQTDFIELAGRNVDFIVKSRLVRKDSLVSISGPESVEFRAVVQRSLAIRSFESVAIVAEGLAGELALAEPLPAGSLRIRSSTTDITGFSPAPGILYADLSEIRKAGSYQVKVRSRAPDGFTVERYEPQTLQVTVVPAGMPGGGAR
jgi:YbbR domain-containing protein